MGTSQEILPIHTIYHPLGTTAQWVPGTDSIIAARLPIGLTIALLIAIKLTF